ncbi:hypothetical protein BF93_18100 [Brachybacterium phenoliresistens]|uniref:Peptidase M28 domain-containing protein n=1 Tax=Brachybacterium phenoliresistens TaxID=396014 RepID=Z9JTG8_9MICO|nr:hypothetical protein [Brachybacterium phenoliresistens]EWS81086.1 hypothetical protein BF93_18100 [Brachybacterium phenoliresistens]
MDISAAREGISRLDALGPRLTGSPAHEALIDDIVARLRELDLPVHTDEHRFTRWDPPSASDIVLEIEAEAGADAGAPARTGPAPARRIPVSAPLHYSGTTPEGGVRGPLRHLGGLLPRWSRARDGIAVLEVDNRSWPMGEVVHVWEGSEPWPRAEHPLLPATLHALGLGAARRAGVRAVVLAWRGIRASGARDQVLPFTLPYQDLPAVFVAGAAADAVVSAARERRRAHLALPAALHPDTPTRTVWSAVEGSERPQETILLVTHTDGPNSVEENGHLALLEIAASLQRTRPRRTVVLVFTTGHLRIPALTEHGQATTRWLADHPRWWKGGHGNRRAVAGLAIEHLGARSMREDGDELSPTGASEPELLYATTPQLAALARRTWQGATDRPVRISRPGALIHFGEGEPLFEELIPAVSLVTAPPYLLSARVEDCVDHELLLRQVASSDRLLRALDALDVAEIGEVDRPGAPAKAVSALRVVAGTLGR